MSIATEGFELIPPPRPILTQLACAAASVVLADWLFYGRNVGISLALFFAVVALLSLVTNRVRRPLRVQILMSGMFVLNLVALIEHVNALSVVLGVLGTGLFVIVLTDSEAQSWQRRLLQAAIAPLLGPIQLVADARDGLAHMTKRKAVWPTASSLVAWIVPAGAFAIFLYLFASANPLIEYALFRIDLRALLAFDRMRVAFWLLVAGAIWSLVLRRPDRKLELPVGASLEATVTSSDWDFLFSTQAVSRSLILLNVLFAVQSGLDLAYLWGGVKLPVGMSYAGYAHRGAYPLMATALLAAAFVLVAMRRDGPAENSALVRPLVLVWIAQNILLVVSAMLRLDLYVAAFSLTEVRLTAFIGMGLVAVSLSLMLIQILLKKPNSWLLTSNAVAVGLTIYGHCFIDYPRLIASYNIEHCQEAGGTGPTLDKGYLLTLGPYALPALQGHLEQVPSLRPVALQLRGILTSERIFPTPGWRAWSFREWRLARYLATNPMPPLAPSGAAGQVQP